MRDPLPADLMRAIKLAFESDPRLAGCGRLHERPGMSDSYPSATQRITSYPTRHHGFGDRAVDGVVIDLEITHNSLPALKEYFEALKALFDGTRSLSLTTGRTVGCGVRRSSAPNRSFGTPERPLYHASVQYEFLIERAAGSGAEEFGLIDEMLGRALKAVAQSAFQANPALFALGELHDTVVPPGSRLPFARQWFVSSPRLRPDGDREIRVATLQLSVFTTGLVELHAYSEAMRTLFDHASTLTVPGASSVRTKLHMDICPDPNTGVSLEGEVIYHAFVEYRFILDTTPESAARPQ